MSKSQKQETIPRTEEKENESKQADTPASTYEMRPSLQNSFKTTLIKEIINTILQEYLIGMIQLLLFKLQLLISIYVID